MAEDPATTHTPARGSRRAARQRALDILYEADIRGKDLIGLLADHAEGDDPPGEFTVALVRGVDRTRAELDALISSHAKDWRIERMPVVDRNLLRLGLYEILHDDDVPNAVAIAEAVGLAKDLSTDDSGRFVNGVLARIADEQKAEPGDEEDGGPGDDQAQPPPTG